MASTSFKYNMCRIAFHCCRKSDNVSLFLDRQEKNNNK
uniref:Uncharacterized protein n=1 Tax=Anguilla anguilla TaxID=7936 RepID=A0A0E9QPL8_ANGAN